MRLSTKCSIALHLLVLIKAFEHGKLTSEILAKSAGCNPVIVRNLLGSLKKAGMVEVQRGTGGATLTADPADVTIWDVYRAVDRETLDNLIGLHPNPFPGCPVGKNIYTLLDKPYRMVSDSVRAAMKSYTLKQLLDEYYAIESPPEADLQILRNCAYDTNIR